MPAAIQKKTVLTPRQQIEAIERGLGRDLIVVPNQLWLNTGNSRLNAVLGSTELGVPYGKIIELFGFNSHGKTMLALLIAALGQADGATVGWVDLENSWDDAWSAAQGLDPEKVFPFKLRLLRPKATKGEAKPPAQLQTINELLKTAEVWMTKQQQDNPTGKRILVVDSIAAMLTEGEAAGGLEDQNMKTGMSLPLFLSRMFRRWVGFAATGNVMMIFVNQIRMKPMAFGNPAYTPGGEATKFYAHIRVEVRRAAKNGRMVQGPRIIGLRGVLKNVKNKAGGGSLEGAQCGYETKFGQKHWKFPSVAEVASNEH